MCFAPVCKELAYRHTRINAATGPQRDALQLNPPPRSTPPTNTRSTAAGPRPRQPQREACPSPPRRPRPGPTPNVEREKSTLRYQCEAAALALQAVAGGREVADTEKKEWCEGRRRGGVGPRTGEMLFGTELEGRVHGERMCGMNWSGRRRRGLPNWCDESRLSRSPGPSATCPWRATTAFCRGRLGRGESRGTGFHADSA